MRYRLIYAALATIIGVFSCDPGVADDRPNIVLIFIDDMGWNDAAYAGSDLYETPNIDRLAGEGMVFTNAYASAGNCEPSRACLLSGQYTPRHDMYAVGSTKRGPVNQMRVLPVPNVNALPQENVTVADALKEAGYVTGMFGKWHLGNNSPHLPKDQGFDVTDSTKPPSKEQFADTNDPKHIYRITQGACEFMERHRDGPFFVYVAHHATHMQIQARRELHEHFRDKGPATLHRDTSFAAMNTQMDDGVGVLLRKIESLGLEDNTLVAFTSDNGGLPQSSQQPLRGFKGMYYEGGIRVPMIVRWPGQIPARSRSAVPVINVDLFPTFLQLAGANPPAGKALDGESLLPLLAGHGQLGRESIFWHFPGYLDRPNPGSRDEIFRTRPVTVIRKGDWKLHLFHEEWSLDGGHEKVATNNSIELYNLAEDISEQNNRVSSDPDKRDELLDDLLVWSRSIDARFAAEPNPEFSKAKARRNRR